MTKFVQESGLKLRQKVRALIRDPRGEVLLVRPHGYASDQWALPGGGVEDGESAEEAVRRELAEELGLRYPGALRQLTVTNRFLYPADYKAKRKLDHDGQSAVMFACDFYAKPTLRLQQEEILDARWFQQQEAARAFPVEAQRALFLACMREIVATVQSPSVAR